MIALALSLSARAQQLVTDVWVHDVPGPPQGDFWDSTISSALGLFSGKAGIYPDVTVCMRPFAGGDRSCTSVCVDLQGDATLGGDGKSTACRRSLRVTLPAQDPRLQIEVLEMDNVESTPRVHAIIAQVGVTDAAACPHAKPCRMDLPTGPLVLSFATQSVKPAQASPTVQTDAAASSPPANCEPPSRSWTDWNKGLHGPYKSADEAMVSDAAGAQAWRNTGPRATLWGVKDVEWGFVILRDRRDGTKYYTTPPVRSSSQTSQPKLQWVDYLASLGKAFDGSCARIQDFIIAANVHTHPLSPFWGLIPSINNFSMNDFAQAIQLKNKYYPPDNTDVIRIGSTDHRIQTRLLVPDLERIYMINANDGIVFTFAPRSGDPKIEDSQIVTDAVAVLYNEIWRKYARDKSRVWAVGVYQ
ncbi:MAG: hypothetical protein JNL55_27195 [Steroidobacter sp.]|nr:hypothetical protein [Steroidobacter sp.]